jgi:hypothetical protein
MKVVFMAFWSRPQRKDIETVKQAVVPQEKPQDAPLPKIELGKMPDRPRFAPLFVKIDRYQEILTIIENIKTGLLKAHDLLTLMQQLDKIKFEAETLMQKNIQETVVGISTMDKEFVRPKGVEIVEDTGVGGERERVENYVGELHRELENLRTQLLALSGAESQI